MKIAIIGGGLTGLTAGYYLSKSGHQVTIFEKNNSLGGLAGSFKQKKWQWPLEFYFHHFFTSDKEIIDLAGEIGLERKIFFLKPKTSIYKAGEIFQFDSLVSVLKSPFLSFWDKVRAGIVTAFLKTTSNWQALEKVTAQKWLERYYGPKAYQILWEPLIKAKFGQKSDEISAAWFWARIKKRSQRLGYFEGGFQTLTDRLAWKITKSQGKIRLNSEIKNLKEVLGFDRIIFAGSVPAFLKIVPKVPINYRNQLGKLEMLGAVNLVLSLKEKFLTDGTYWLNINETGFPFVAAVEQTNFIEPKYYGGDHLLYLGGYYPPDHRYFKMTKEEIFKEFQPYLKKINPFFNFKLLTLDLMLFTNKNAQPIIPTNYSKLIPPIKTPLKNLYLASMHQIYPWDRGTNYAVELGKKVADEILEEI